MIRDPDLTKSFEHHRSTDRCIPSAPSRPQGCQEIICRPVLPTHSVPYSAAGEVPVQRRTGNFRRAQLQLWPTNASTGEPTPPVSSVGSHPGRATLQLIAPGQTLSAPESGYRKTIEDDFHWHLQIFAANRPRDGRRVGIRVLPGAAGNCRSVPLGVTEPGSNDRLSERNRK